MKAAQLMDYDRWMAEHLEELVDQYAGKVVAIYQGSIVLVGDTEAEVYRILRDKGFTEMSLVFRVPQEEDFHSIL